MKSFTMGFTPEWAPWLTAHYQNACAGQRGADLYNAPDYYEIMAALRARTQGEA